MYRSRSCILASAVALSLVLAARDGTGGSGDFRRRDWLGGRRSGWGGDWAFGAAGSVDRHRARRGLGGLTDPGAVNLGEPIWKRYSTSPGTQSSGGAKTSNMVAATQANLTRLGYRPGPVDGLYGPQTSDAIRQYQRDHGLPIDGKLSGQVALKIENRAGGLQ